MPRADRPLSGRIRRLSSRSGAAAVVPPTCAGLLPVCEERCSSPTTTGSTIAARQERERVRSPTGTFVVAVDTVNFTVLEQRSSGL